MSERISPNHRESILELIEAEQDGTKRAHLMIMLRILDSLEKVSATALSIESELSIHKIEFEEYKAKLGAMEKSGNELINKGKGAIWSAVFLVGIIEALLMYQFNQFADSVRELSKIVHQNETNIAIIKANPTVIAPTYQGNKN